MGDFSTTRDEPLITRSKRHFTPDNFLLKIESFSLLSKYGLDFKSDVFEAGGHKWRLSLHPKGIETNGSGHISLYLAIVETGKLPLGWEVNASFKLFVFDQIRDEYYLTVQGAAAGGAIKRFNDINREWGFAKFLPLDTFNDVSQGYLVKNCCVFGVEVVVHERNVKRQCLSMIEGLANNTFTWKIERFSTLNELYYSQEFTAGNSQWKLVVYPKGDPTVKKTVISVFLRSCSCGLSEQNVFAEYKLRIIDQISGNHDEGIVENWFDSPEEGCGYPEFLLLKDLNTASNGFLVNDTLLVEAEILVMSKLK